MPIAIVKRMFSSYNAATEFMAYSLNMKVFRLQSTNIRNNNLSENYAEQE